MISRRAVGPRRDDASAPIGPQPVISTRWPSSEPARVDRMQGDGEGLGDGGLADGMPSATSALRRVADQRSRKPPWICGIGMALP